jgi:hypothetical protein
MPPPHVTVPCHFCEQPVHPRAVGTFELVTGWGEYRENGGMNAVRLPELHRKYAHRTCVERAKHGHVPGQTDLLDQGEQEDTPKWDGTQEGFTPVSCPHCGTIKAAKHMAGHVESCKGRS